LHTDRLLALLREGRRIKHEHTVCVANLLTHLPRQFSNQRPVVPRTLADEFLQLPTFLVMQVRDRLDILPLDERHQTREVLATMPALLDPAQRFGKRHDKLLQTTQQPVKLLRCHDRILHQLLKPHDVSTLHRHRSFRQLPCCARAV
jgi:hypothetical protein